MVASAPIRPSATRSTPHRYLEVAPARGTRRLPPRKGQRMVIKRRHFKQEHSLEERLTEEAKSLREEASVLPAGMEKEQLLKRTRQAETGAHMSE